MITKWLPSTFLFTGILLLFLLSNRTLATIPKQKETNLPGIFWKQKGDILRSHAPLLHIGFHYFWSKNIHRSVCFHNSTLKHSVLRSAHRRGLAAGTSCRENSPEELHDKCWSYANRRIDIQMRESKLPFLISDLSFTKLTSLLLHLEI